MRLQNKKNWMILIAAGILICIFFIFLNFIFLNLAEAFIFDDFEYWDSPYNHGWQTSDPSYPVNGFGIGYGLIYTQLDKAEGSRVLCVHCSPSVMNGLQPYCLAYYSVKDPTTGQPPQGAGLTYKIKAPVGLEKFTQVQCYVLVKTKENSWIWLNYSPIDGQGPQNLGTFSPPIPLPKSLAAASPTPCISYPLGREIQDTTWHLVVRNLQEDLDQAQKASLLPKPQHLGAVYGILFLGNEYSLDEISFSEDLARYKNRRPSLYCPGPQFATLFEPFELILYANDRDKDPLTFEVQIGGWGAQGTKVNKGVVLPLPLDPNDPMTPFSTARAAFRFTPQCLEDLIITATVRDKYNSDVNVFPLSVVNYHISNHPPVIQRMGKFVGYVDEPFTYQVKVFDQDRDQLTYSAIIDGLPNYQYGPWQESIINPHTGLIQFTPRFEGDFRIEITVQDEKGAIAKIKKKMTVVNRGSWFNHPPRGTKIYSPQLARAGTLFTLVTSISDPDGDKLYYSTNIGTISSEGVYSILTYFPGQYKVIICACDIYGC
ncbi:MAG: hypothetical protein K6U11_11975 [bacterium]|nr:hypothetical protein [bacterium]